MHTEEKWTAVITPHDRNLKREIAELWNYRELIKMFVKRDVKTMYAQTILGPLWFVVHSILSASVMTLVFDKIAGISTDGIPGFLFYMVGNVLWLNFSGCVTSVSETFLKNARLMGKVYFPRLSVPIATIISEAFSVMNGQNAPICMSLATGQLVEGEYSVDFALVEPYGGNQIRHAFLQRAVAFRIEKRERMYELDWNASHWGSVHF